MFPVMEVKEKKACSFERIYFSRGTDPEIYNERKMLGSLLVPKILKEINFDLKNTVFSYIPNTSESAFLGLMATVDDYLIARRKEVVIDGKPSVDSLEEILSFRPRVEKLILKDAKLRTFIADDDHRDEMVAHAYDTTFEVINKNVDTIVVIDDSIVRGTTLEKSILKMLDTLCPKKIIVVSSAPQIRFPDCYGIDMSKITEFVAFRAMIALIKERKMDHLLEEVYDQCKAAGKEKDPINHVNKLYKQFTVEEISDKISEIVKTDGIKAEVKVIYQSVENLHKACPNHLGDWYFTGDFPTPGGNKVTNKAFVNFMEGKSERAY
ncbi:MAG: amidophosphoribosyltransferase, partial [Cyclobacteriaceae bacterium]|nr:amidophosphoribosyltransferase [Cyclobacteriaceae bacterium]